MVARVQARTHLAAITGVTWLSGGHGAGWQCHQQHMYISLHCGPALSVSQFNKCVNESLKVFFIFHSFPEMLSSVPNDNLLILFPLCVNWSCLLWPFGHLLNEKSLLTIHISYLWQIYTHTCAHLQGSNSFFPPLFPPCFYISLGKTILFLYIPTYSVCLW